MSVVGWIVHVVSETWGDVYSVTRLVLFVKQYPNFFIVSRFSVTGHNVSMATSIDMT